MLMSEPFVFSQNILKLNLLLFVLNLNVVVTKVLFLSIVNSSRMIYELWQISYIINVL